MFPLQKSIAALLLVSILSLGINAAPVENTSLTSQSLSGPGLISVSLSPATQKQPAKTQSDDSTAQKKEYKLQQAVAPEGSKQQLNAEKIAALRKKLNSANFLSKVEKQVLDAQNKERIRLGLSPLAFDKDLQTAARQRSYELYKSDTFAHKRPDGSMWHTVLQEDVPYTFVKAGENLCTTEYNDPNVKIAYDADFWTEEWINSPTHYEVMSDPIYTNAGVGIYCVTKNGMVYAYATTLFSRPTQ